MTRHCSRLALALSLAGAVAGMLAVAAAQPRFAMATRERGRDPAALDVPYDGRLVFARLRYEMGFRSGFFGRDLPWAHDYPRAEYNLMKILESISYVRPYVGENGGNIFGLGDGALFKFPIAYMSEPGYWTMTDEEAASLRSYLLRGGFLIFDDFRSEHWYNFEAQLRRVLPEHRLVKLDGMHSIFHSFFEIPEPLDFIPQYDQHLQPVFYGVFEDNDPRRRLMAIANYNNDIGEYWEYSDMGFVPIDLSNEAFKFGVNYMMYGMTH